MAKAGDTLVECQAPYHAEILAGRRCRRGFREQPGADGNTEDVKKEGLAVRLPLARLAAERNAEAVLPTDCWTTTATDCPSPAGRISCRRRGGAHSAGPHRSAPVQTIARRWAIRRDPIVTL